MVCAVQIQRRRRCLRVQAPRMGEVRGGTEGAAVNAVSQIEAGPSQSRLSRRTDQVSFLFAFHADTSEILIWWQMFDDIPVFACGCWSPLTPPIIQRPLRLFFLDAAAYLHQDRDVGFRSTLHKEPSRSHLCCCAENINTRQLKRESGKYLTNE